METSHFNQERLPSGLKYLTFGSKFTNGDQELKPGMFHDGLKSIEFKMVGMCSVGRFTNGKNH